MTDYISRDKAIEITMQYCPDDDGSCSKALADLREMLDEIESIPAADVRLVITCGECKWTKTDEVEDPAIYCRKWDRWEMPPDGFCWLGKKREES